MEERSKTLIFFFFSPFVVAKLSVVLFFFWFFSSHFGEEDDAVRCKCFARGRFFSLPLSLSQIAVVVVVDVSIDWKEVERICRPLFCPSISARLYLLLLLGYNKRQPQTSHSAAFECRCRRELIDFGARVHWKAPPLFLPSWNSALKKAIPLYRMFVYLDVYTSTIHSVLIFGLGDSALPVQKKKKVLAGREARSCATWWPYISFSVRIGIHHVRFFSMEGPQRATPPQSWCDGSIKIPLFSWMFVSFLFPFSPILSSKSKSWSIPIYVVRKNTSLASTLDFVCITRKRSSALLFFWYLYVHTTRNAFNEPLIRAGRIGRYSNSV